MRSADCGFGLSVWSQTVLDYASTVRYVANHLCSICIVGVPRAGPTGCGFFLPRLNALHALAVQERRDIGHIPKSVRHLRAIAGFSAIPQL
jgi:hypothetical protein